MRIDHKNGTIHFGKLQLESDRLRGNISMLARRLAKACSLIDPVPAPDKEEAKKKVRRPLPSMAGRPSRDASESAWSVLLQVTLQQRKKTLLALAGRLNRMGGRAQALAHAVETMARENKRAGARKHMIEKRKEDAERQAAMRERREEEDRLLQARLAEATEEERRRQERYTPSSPLSLHKCQPLPVSGSTCLLSRRQEKRSPHLSVSTNYSPCL